MFESVLGQHICISTVNYSSFNDNNGHTHFIVDYICTREGHWKPGYQGINEERGNVYVFLCQAAD